MVLDKINIDFKNHDYLPEEKEAYQIGEEINEKIKVYLISGMDKGDLCDDLKIMPAIFNFWVMLSGIIQLAATRSFIETARNMCGVDCEITVDTVNGTHNRKGCRV